MDRYSDRITATAAQICLSSQEGYKVKSLTDILGHFHELHVGKTSYGLPGMQHYIPLEAGTLKSKLPVGCVIIKNYKKDLNILRNLRY